MKKLLNILCLVILGTGLTTSCSKNDNFNEEAIKQAGIKADKQLDSIFTDERLRIEQYVSNNFQTPVEDTVTVAYQYIDKKIKRGLWYEIVSEPTDDSYEYKGQQVNSGYGYYYFAPVLPTVKIKYTAKLISDGTIVQSDVNGSTYNLSTTGSTIFNQAWKFAFVPYKIQYNGEPQEFGGLTANGLKKGSIIRVVTPSYWAFGSNKNGNIPANSPLVYEFEVLEIN